MDTIVDVSHVCGSSAPALAAAGVQTVIRYYSRDTARKSKRLSHEEAAQHGLAGLRIGVVHEGRFGNQFGNFDYPTGLADAAYAHDYARDEIGQPAGSTIYFAVDFDATKSQIKDRILPYFRGIADAFAAAGTPPYEVGVYGSGAVCRAVLDAGLAHRAWLAQSTGWMGYDGFSSGLDWALKQAMGKTVAGVDCDPNTASKTISMGDFVYGGGAVSALATVEVPRGAMRVNARSGLRLRPGPGTSFDPVMTLPFSQLVYPLRSVGDWTLVDLNGDGAADGFVSSAFLIDTEAGSSLPPSSPVLVSSSIPDAVHVPELVLQGSTPAGLKAAQTKAAAALPGYPKNGCATHLSALLEHSGIEVPMTWGAGKLAQRLWDRGWSKVAVGNQQPGDVGVCFDNDPKVAGSDHIYLVVI
jgi:hypothetical protein